MKENINANNPIVQFNLDKPLIWLQFSKLPEDAKVEYVTKLRKEYRCSAKQLARMFGCSVSWVEDWLVSHGFDNVIRQREDRKKAWEAFTDIQAEPEEAKPEEVEVTPMDTISSYPTINPMWKLMGMDPKELTEDERKRLERYRKIPEPVLNCLNKRIDEITTLVAELEAERDALIDYAEGWSFT